MSRLRPERIADVARGLADQQESVRRATEWPRSAGSVTRTRRHSWPAPSTTSNAPVREDAIRAINPLGLEEMKEQSDRLARHDPSPAVRRAATGVLADGRWTDCVDRAGDRLHRPGRRCPAGAGSRTRTHRARVRRQPAGDVRGPAGGSRGRRGVQSFLDYYYLLKYDAAAAAEWARAMDALSVPETYFWRDRSLRAVPPSSSRRWPGGHAPDPHLVRALRHRREPLTPRDAARPARWFGAGRDRAPGQRCQPGGARQGAPDAGTASGRSGPCPRNCASATSRATERAGDRRHLVRARVRRGRASTCSPP